MALSVGKIWYQSLRAFSPHSSQLGAHDFYTDSFKALLGFIVLLVQHMPSSQWYVGSREVNTFVL